MRLTHHAMLNRLVREREQLIEQRDAIVAGRGLVVQFNGVALDNAVQSLVRPAVAGELSGRLRRIEADLKAIGVEL